jgi:hypothetical protein
MENHFGFTKQIWIITWNYNSIIISIGIRLTCQSKSVSHNNTCHMATHRSRPVAFLCLRVNIVKLCLFPIKNKLWFSWCTFAITVRVLHLIPRCDSVMYEFDFLTNGDGRQETKMVKNIYCLKNWNKFDLLLTVMDGERQRRWNIFTVCHTVTNMSWD